MIKVKKVIKMTEVIKLKSLTKTIKIKEIEEISRIKEKRKTTLNITYFTQKTKQKIYPKTMQKPFLDL